ncbi:hypothetical protein ACTFIW_007372 [Dictyostelium discoideum]
MEREEILFWKIFKNKYLFKEIFKKKSFRLGCYSYYECNKVDWMIDNGYFNLLYYKIDKNDKNLIIDEKTIFKYFQNDNSIFSKLFKNYPNLINLVSEMIENNNLQAFKVIVYEYNYIATESNLLFSIRCGSFLISDFIMMIGHVKITNELKDKIWENSIGYRALKCLNLIKTDNELHLKKCKYFIDNYLNDQYKTLPKPISIDLKYVVPDKYEVFGVKSLKIYDCFKNFFNMLIYEKSLEFILNCCSIIASILNLQSEPFNSQHVERKERPLFILTNEEINEMVFTSTQLSTIIGECDSNDDRIKKLFIMVVYFTDDLPLGLNYNFLGLKYFKELECYLRSFNPNHFATYDGKSIYGRIILQTPFKYCKNDRNGESIIEYIKKSLDDINDKSIEITNKFPIDKLFETCFRHNDLKLLELVYDGLSNNNNNNNNFTFPIHTFTRIESIKIFDFIFNKINTEQSKIESFEYIYGNYQLANHFKENYSNYYYQACSEISSSYLPIDYNDSIQFLIENWRDFNFDPIEIRRYLLYHFCIINPTKINELNKIEESNIPYNIFSECSQSKLIQLNYILNFRYNEFINGTIENISSQELFMVSYLRGQLKEFLENGLINIDKEINEFHPDSVFHSLSIEIYERNDYKTFKFLLSFYSKNSKLVEYFKNLYIFSKFNKN